MKQLMCFVWLLVVSHFETWAQSNITYYDQYGFRVGRAEVRPYSDPYQPTFKRSTYESGVPLDLVMQVGAQKQRLFDQRRVAVQQKIDEIGRVLNRRLYKYPEEQKYYYGHLTRVISKLNKFGDLTQNRIFNDVMSDLYALEDAIYIELEEIASSAGDK